jgi:transcription elongation factor Elf1
MSEQMEPIQPVVGRAMRMIAEHAFPQGSIFRCIPCGKQRNCTTSEIAEGMSKGFPKCRICGKTVDLVTPRDK